MHVLHRRHLKKLHISSLPVFPIGMLSNEPLSELRAFRQVYSARGVEKSEMQVSKMRIKSNMNHKKDEEMHHKMDWHLDRPDLMANR